MILTVVLFHLGQLLEQLRLHFPPDRTVADLKQEVRAEMSECVCACVGGCAHVCEQVWKSDNPNRKIMLVYSGDLPENRGFGNAALTKNEALQNDFRTLLYLPIGEGIHT